MEEPTRVLGEEPSSVAWVVVISDGAPGRNFHIGQMANIGRDATQCDVVLDDDSASAEHARIREEGGQYVLYDLASTNGTFVNGQRVQRMPLLDGDEIIIGRTKLVFKEVKS